MTDSLVGKALYFYKGTWSGRPATGTGNSSGLLLGHRAFFTDLNSKGEWDGTEWQQTSTAGSKHVVITGDETVIPKFDQQIYNGIAVGSVRTDAGIEVYNDWLFQVIGVDADDDITIQISLDGVNFIKPGLVDVMTGALIDQTAANIEAPGIYRFGNIAEQSPITMSIKAIDVVRETAVTGNAVFVDAIGSIRK